MMNSLKSQKDKMKNNQKKGRRLKVATFLCSIFVVGAVLWGLILPGIAMSGKTYCGLEEHTHSEACYTKELTCGQEESGEHTHSDACYTQTLTCGKEEHTHTDLCRSNPEADVETAKDWEASLADSGYDQGENWNQKITAIAESQLGYTESVDNFALGDDNSHKGYTRYGAWATATTDYGTWSAENMTYSDWDTLLAAFALNYAGVDKNIFPVNSDANAWMDALKAADLFGDAASDYRAGDLVFLNKTGDQETLYQVGIIDIVGTGDDGAKNTITVIQGNDGNAVTETKYEVTDSQIIGYGLVSRAWESSQELQDAENQDAADNGNDLFVLADNDTVDQGLVLNITANPSAEANGKTLYINVNSANSHPNETATGEVVQLKISDLPDGVTLAGFDESGKMIVSYGDSSTTGTIEVTLHKKENGKPDYITYTQPAGSTVNFKLQFNSSNGIMDKTNSVEVTPSITNKQPNDRVYIDGTDVTNQADAAKVLAWTGENKWDNLNKTVNHSELEIDASTNRLIGNLEYNVSAQEKQGDGSGDTGSIWTKEVVLEDTLTLPDGMTFPEGVKVENNKIVDSSGNTIFEFNFSSLENTEKQSVNVDSVTVASDRKSVSYKIIVTNTNKNSNGSYIGEMDSINNLKANLDASKLVLSDAYKTMDNEKLKTKKITNTVKIKTTAVKGDDTYKDQKSVDTKPTKKEKYSITKEADKTSVKPGGTIKYTITVKNTGNQPLPATDKNGQNYTITDTLPSQLALTDEQKQAIENAGGTVTENNGTYTIIFTQKDEIQVGGELKFVFDVTVKDEGELADSKNIKNKAIYRNQSSEVNVNVEKTNINLSKNVDKTDDVKNGDILTYTITVNNPNNFATTFDEILTDKLNEHLILQGMYSASGEKITEKSGKYDVASTSSSGKHSVEFTKTSNADGTTTLKWNVGKLESNETVTIIYKVKVDLNVGSSITSITNEVKSDHGETGRTDTKVTPPTTVDKKVKAETEDDSQYNDGGESYQNNTVLDYKISITNASGDEASTKEHHVLTDTIDGGLLLKLDDDKLYEYSGNASEYEKGQVTVDKLTESATTLENFLQNSGDWKTYFAIINRDIVKIEKEWSGKTYFKTKLTWYIGKLNPGDTVEKTYQVTLKMSDSDGNSPSYANTVTDGGGSKTVTVNGYKEGITASAADIKKNVWTIATSSDNWALTTLNNKKYFNLMDGKDNYVIYSITVANTGEDDIEVRTITDEYGENLEYIAFSPALYNLYFYQFQYKNKWTEEISTVHSSNMSEWLDSATNKSEVTIKKIEDDTETHTVTYQVGSNQKGGTLPKGKTISFFVLCKVKNPTEGTLITNTAKLYTNKSVEYKDCGTIKTKGTKDDAYQNNGTSTDLGTEGDQRVISSSVTIIPKDKIIPGITKEAVGYVVGGKQIGDLQAITAANKKNNINPCSAVKWELKLYNDGTVPIQNYTISDSVDAPFHILTEKEATNLGITTEESRKNNKVFLLEIYDSKNAENPSKTYDLSSDVWKQIQGGTNGSYSTSFSLDLTDEKYTIPAGGYAKFTVYTNNVNQQTYTIYQNEATFTPKDNFDGTDVTTGQVVEDASGTVTGVKASDSVYAMGDYGSFSWKTITEEANANNTAVGYDTSNNYIVIDNEDTNKKVIYTNNVENVSKHAYKNLTILDLMPFPSDNGVVNSSQKRGSEFTVGYNEKLVLTVKDTNGNVTKTLNVGEDYSIQFSTKTTFTNGDTGHGNSEDWHGTWESGDKSFRILLSDSFTLQPNETLCIQYEGLIGDDVKPGKIAWNSFGYAYDVEGMSRLIAEPPKVGVKIPVSPTITKKVVDSAKKDQGYDETKNFTFKVYEGDKVDEANYKGTFTLHQGESKKFTTIVDEESNKIFVSGNTYTLVEVVDSTYTFQSVKGTGDTSETTNNDGYTFTYISALDNYNITFTNKFNAYELPGTGGIGTKPFLISGAALMSLALLLLGYNWKRKRR